MVTHHCHTSLSLTSQAPFTKSLWPKSPRSTVVWPLALKESTLDDTLDALWVCPVRKLPWKRLCAASLALCYKMEPWAKIADLYCSGNTPQEWLCNWKRVLQALRNCNLRLSAHKTIINPKTTTILDWIWSACSLSASPRHLNTLATYRESSTVGQVRSIIGSHKALSCVIPRCSSYPTPLNAVTASRPSQETISWTNDLRTSFHSAQKALSSALTITLPRPEDQIWIVTDGAVRDPGIGTTLYVTHSDKLLVSGFFSAKLYGSQTTWLPCEVEALSIAAATKHFSHPSGPASSPTASPVFRPTKSSAVGSFLPALVYPLSCPLCAATKLQSGMLQAPLPSSQTSRAEMPPPVTTRPVRCAPSLLEPWTLSS